MVSSSSESRWELLSLESSWGSARAFMLRFP
jgi:hypothetical protein